MELNTTKERLATDPASSTLVSYLELNSHELGLENCLIYFEFPLYKEEDILIVSKVLVVSPYHGLLVFGTTNANQHDVGEQLKRADSDLDFVFAHLYSRLIKNKKLRKTRKDLAFKLDAVLYAPYLENKDSNEGLEADLLISEAELNDYINGHYDEPIDDSLIAEIISTIEGTKGLLRPKERDVSKSEPNSKVAQVAALEAEINRFDRDQKNGYMAVLEGPQRIRGLAGSGKTIVLAMKAALTHLRNPEARIAFTFYTKSLYQHVRRLITRFYRQFDDQDPDWDKIDILHAWGGQTIAGIYYNACISHGQQPLTFGAAKAKSYANPFGYACEALLSNTTINPVYDYVFVDEAQDFPASFLRLALALAKNNRLVFASDELQNIFQAEVPSVEEIFGVDESGNPVVTLDEDVVLHKCYRNPLEILVSAHALGFGIYSNKIVQMLENEDHWKDVGYVVEKGPLSEGEKVSILRPRENSPSTISERNPIDEIISANVFKQFDDEVEYICDSIVNDINVGGLKPEDVLVISADDRHAKSYFQEIARYLRDYNIPVNNLQVDTYGVRDFFEEGEVTLSTVHKAKGNEGYMVYILGIDALFFNPNVRFRNMIFTAMTRAKAWLKITGIGRPAEFFKSELDKAKGYCPKLEFTYPSEPELKVMHRDLKASEMMDMDRTLDELQEELPLDEFTTLLEKRLGDIRKTKARAGEFKKKKISRVKRTPKK